MEMFLACASLLLISLSSILGGSIDIPAYEYVQRFKTELSIGECPNKFVAYPDGNSEERCNFPKRTGKSVYREKTVNTSHLFVLDGPAELFNIIRLCDGQSANYFGLLTKGDCVATEIATKLSFKRKHLTLMRHDYYRPRVNFLSPSTNLAIPDEYNHYLSNAYYTRHIDIGTEEVIIVDMQFPDLQDTQLARSMFSPFYSLTENLQMIGQQIGSPRKVKVIRLSTAVRELETRVFKGLYTSLESAKRLVGDIERNIVKLRHDLQQKKINSHLKYGFRTYEIGPVALPYSSTWGAMKEKQMWSNVTLLQVEAERVYVTNKRFRKQCRGKNSNKSLRKYCPLIKHALGELKKARVTIRTQRRDWNRLSYEEQTSFITIYKRSVKKLKTNLKLTSKAMKRELRLNRQEERS